MPVSLRAASSPTSPSWWRSRWPSASRCAPGTPATGHVLATPRAQRAASHVALAAVAALVALIAAEVHFSAGYAAVAAALVVFLLASAVVGRLLGLRAPRRVAAALLLTTSMRDFAIAAGLAAAAFGPAAAAPLGLYGILVLVWGTAAAGALRRRTAATECQYGTLPSQSACNRTPIRTGDWPWIRRLQQLASCPTSCATLVLWLSERNALFLCLRNWRGLWSRQPGLRA